MPARQSAEYLLMAEFDIDKGPIISHQYPEPLSSDVTQLAELMLPDQTHVRSEDWTIFFLHFTPAGRKRPGPSDVLDEPEEPPLMYVLNLVNTKHDKEARRGAQVKALAIVTRHAFLHIYKPLLLLALDEFFRATGEISLAPLFAAVNAMDLSSMPRLNQLERLILLQSDREDLYTERFPAAQRERSDTTSSDTSYISVNLESMAIEPLITSPPPTSLAQPRASLHDTHEFNTSITYHDNIIPIKVPMTALPEIVGDFSITQLIATFSKAASTATPYPLHASLTTSGPHTHPVIVLLNALLTQCRVVFLGQSQPSGVVASHVLAACAMASGGTGLLRSFTERAFPYTDLSKIEDLLTVDGFIAGVTNSIFTLHPEWWDVMANIDTGQIIISPHKQLDGQGPATSTTSTTTTQHDSGDTAFMEDVTGAIADRCHESVVRLKFRDFVQRIMHITAEYEVAKYGTSDLTPLGAGSFLLAGHGIVWRDGVQRARNVAANAGRCEAWAGTESYVCAVADRRAQFVRGSSRVRTIDLAHQVGRLKHATPDASAAIFIVLNQEILTHIHLTELLTLMPMASGGMSALAQGLFHPQPNARRSAISLIERVREHAVGRHFYAGLSRFYRAAHERMMADLDREDPLTESASA